MAPLLGDDANRGWNTLVGDVTDIFKDRSIDDVKKPVDPNHPQTQSTEKKRHTLLELFIISIITAIGLSIGYKIVDFILDLL